MAQIDDPATQLELQGAPVGERFDSKLLAVQVCGALLSTVAPGWSAGLNLLGFVQSYYSSQQTEARLRLLFESIQLRVEVLATELGSASAKWDQCNADGDRDRAIARGILETATSADDTVVKNIGIAIATQHVVAPTTWAEVNSMVADLTRLTEGDLEALGVLYSQQYQIVSDPSAGTHAFHEKHKDVMGAVTKAGFSREQFFGHCGRLFGFGLAIHINQNTNFEGPDELCFAMTTRGLVLGTLLGFRSQ